MPNNKRHTLKTIKKRENLHPYSRKAKQLERIVMRKDKITSKDSQQSKKANIAARWLWFRYALDEDQEETTIDGMHELIQAYIERNSEEMEQLQAQRKITKRPKSQREHLIEATMTSDKDEYRSGMDLPDLTSRKMVQLIREWDGDINGMSRIRTIRLRQPVEKTTQQQQPRQTKASAMAIDNDHADTDMMDTK
ncbi:hypothetical protein BC940DRAFT_305214 [Gongronella butleri]|nr:hypothetical protein BC940DRAFT_305214 [Gongronella butleri]